MYPDSPDDVLRPGPGTCVELHLAQVLKVPIQPASLGSGIHTTRVIPTAGAELGLATSFAKLRLDLEGSQKHPSIPPLDGGVATYRWAHPEDFHL